MFQPFHGRGRGRFHGFDGFHAMGGRGMGRGHGRGSGGELGRPLEGEGPDVVGPGPDFEGRGRRRFGRHSPGRCGPLQEMAMHRGPKLGVRRPLRFLAHNLELDPDQMEGLARILGELKTERGQATVDRERSAHRAADALEADDLDAEALNAALAARVEAEKKLQEAVQSGMTKLHALLRPDQRRKLSTLLRGGVLEL